MIRVDIGDSADLIEVTAHRHHPKVLGGELDLRVIRVQLPVAHGEPPCSPLGLDTTPNMPPVAIVAGGIAAGGARSGRGRAGRGRGQAARLARGEGVDEEVADGLEVPGRGRGYLGVTGTGAGGVGRAPRGLSSAVG